METSLKVENLFGMASCNAGGAMFVFGGSTHNRYADATITMMWLGDNREDPWEAMQSSEGEICSSKKVSNKNIIIIWFFSSIYSFPLNFIFSNIFLFNTSSAD